jgi:hypothetical protein
MAIIARSFEKIKEADNNDGKTKCRLLNMKIWYNLQFGIKKIVRRFLM